MNKIEKLFAYLLNHLVKGHNTTNTIKKECAVITKDIAVNFSLWQQGGDCEWILNDQDEWYIPYNPHVRINTEQLFDKYLKTL